MVNALISTVDNSVQIDAAKGTGVMADACSCRAAAVDAHREECRRLWDATVVVLTAAVRLSHPQHGPVDFADFLASALGAVVGNLGSAERITAGRPGSWESDLLAQLVAGTVGYHPDAELLAAVRTQDVVVRLNVAQLLNETRQDTPEGERAGLLLDLDDALDALPDPWRDGREPTEKDEIEWETAQTELRRRNAEAFAAYGQLFTAAVLDAAQDLKGLTVKVQVETDTDPDATWWREGDVANPREWDEDDQLAWRLWDAARQRGGLPALHGETLQAAVH